MASQLVRTSTPIPTSTEDQIQDLVDRGMAFSENAVGQRSSATRIRRPRKAAGRERVTGAHRAAFGQNAQFWGRTAATELSYAFRNRPNRPETGQGGISPFSRGRRDFRANGANQANLGNALHHAAGFNAYDAAEALINSRSDMNDRDIHDETPLHWAARWQEDAAVAQLLIKAGASKTIHSSTGQNPYDIALTSSSYFADLLVL